MNEVYESLKQYYDEHGEIMPPSQFIKFRGKYTEQEMVQAVIEFDSYLDQIRGVLGYKFVNGVPIKHKKIS